MFIYHCLFALVLKSPNGEWPITYTYIHAHRHQDIQMKTNDVALIGRQVGLNINTDKTKLMKINARSDQQVTIDNKNIEEVQEFVYLGSKITTDGNSEMDVLLRLSKVRGDLRYFGTSGGLQRLAPKPN